MIIINNKFIDDLKRHHTSIKSHLSNEYGKQYNVRRTIGCLLVFLTLRYMQTNNGNDLISIYSIIPLIWAILSFIFWHYSYWSYKGGIIDRISSSIMYFGSFWSIIWKLLVQNIVILLWISIIAPITGLFTWRKAVRTNSILKMDSKWEQ